MHVIVVLGLLELGGAERQGVTLARYLRDHCGYEVSVVGLSKPGRVCALCDESGLVWHSFPDPFESHFPKKDLVAFARRLRKLKPDALISFTGSANVPCALVWRLTGARICIWSQRDAGSDSIVLEAWPAALGKQTVFTANSSAAAEVLYAFGVTPGTVHVIPNGVGLAPVVKSRKEWRRELGIGPDALVACMLANLSKYKDHKTLLEAWRTAMDRGGIPEGARLLLAGREDEKAAELQAFVGHAEIEDVVLFLGQVSDVGGLLRAADIGVFSGFRESLPNAVIEGMMAELPFVATDIPGVRAALGDVDGNLWVPPGDVQAMATALEVMFRDAALRKKAGQENLRRSYEFSPERMGRAFSSLLTSSLAGKGSLELRRFLFSMRDRVELLAFPDLCVHLGKRLIKRLLGEKFSLAFRKFRK